MEVGGGPLVCKWATLNLKMDVGGRPGMLKNAEKW